MYSKIKNPHVLAFYSSKMFTHFNVNQHKKQINFCYENEFKNSFYDIPKEYEDVIPYISLHLLINRRMNDIR